MKVAHEGEGEYLVVAADIGEPPPQGLEKLYQVLLDAGHRFAGAGGGVFAQPSGRPYLAAVARGVLDGRHRKCDFEGESPWRLRAELA